VRGEVKVKPFTSAPENLCAYGPLLNERGAVVLTPKRWRAVKDALAITGPEVPTREAAQALRGTALYVPRGALPAAEEGEYYVADLIGCAVRRADGTALGVVRAVHDYGAGDVLEIAWDSATWRLPFTNDNAPEIDLAQRVIIADPPDGLLPEDRA
jgi:16S rRNA processing protein RimM